MSDKQDKNEQDKTPKEAESDNSGQDADALADKLLQKMKAKEEAAKQPGQKELNDSGQSVEKEQREGFVDNLISGLPENYRELLPDNATVEVKESFYQKAIAKIKGERDAEKKKVTDHLGGGQTNPQPGKPGWSHLTPQGKISYFFETYGQNARIEKHSN